MDATTLGFPIAKYIYKYIYEHFKGKYTKRILDELKNGILNETEARKIDSEIYKFCLFQDSLERASTYEKANLLKTLYLSLNGEDDISCSDDLFFEIFSILGELSDREIRLLYLLEIYSKDKMKNKDSDDEKYGKYFVLMEQKNKETFGNGAKSDVFYYFAAEKIKSEPKIVGGLMKRLERTGLITPTGLDGNACFQEYGHTELYREIRSRIILAMDYCYNENLLLTSSDI